MGTLEYAAFFYLLIGLICALIQTALEIRDNNLKHILVEVAQFVVITFVWPPFAIFWAHYLLVRSFYVYEPVEEDDDQV